MPVVAVIESREEDVTANSIVRGALTFHLNRLSPGETLDADTASVCLDALADVLDELDGCGVSLFREVSVASEPITGSTATFTDDWPSIKPGQSIRQATIGPYNRKLSPITMAQLQASIPAQGQPREWAFDGLETVHFYPACSGEVVTLLVRERLAAFADMHTGALMPAGYRSALSAMLAEKMAPSLLGQIPQAISRAASIARSRLRSRGTQAAILQNHTSLATGSRYARDLFPGA